MRAEPVYGTRKRAFFRSFFRFWACILSTLGYNGGMKQTTKNELLLAIMASSPVFGLLGFLICYNLPSWV